MNPNTPSDQLARRRQIVFWILWLAIINGLVMIRLFLGAKSGAHPASNSVMMVVPIGALMVSAVIRFIVLPRQTDATKALPFFIAGLATAEGCGITGIFLTGPRADVFVGLALAMLLIYAPAFALRLQKAKPVSDGFRN